MPSRQCVPETLGRALAARGYTSLTLVQAAVADATPRDADILLSAATGSGKTIACGLAMAAHLLDDDGSQAGRDGLRVIVLTPTRELAAQVCAELRWLYAGVGVRVGCCTGGTALSRERAMLREGLEILVATPGRLRHHLARNGVPADDVSCVVLDEADDMLDRGFREDLEAILGALPSDRRMLMFSATITDAVEALAARLQRAPLRIEMGMPGGHEDIVHVGVVASSDRREAAVVNVLRYHEPKAALVFCARRAGVEELSRDLAARGFRTVSLSGAMAQADRDVALAAMRAGRARVCVATDVAARGLDLPDLEMVIHADPPVNWSMLMHRSGRTGRAGRKGLAIVIASPRQRRRFDAMTVRAGPWLDWIAPPGRDAIEERDAKRLLAASVLTREPSPLERERGALLLDAHAPEHVAAALHRIWSGSLPDAVEMADVDRARVRPAGVWYCLDYSPGRRSGIRSLLSMLTRMGGVARDDIGRVHVLENETHFELASAAAAAFEGAMSARGPSVPSIRRLAGGFKPFVRCARPSADGSDREAERIVPYQPPV